jgi:hypothetical protein
MMHPHAALRYIDDVMGHGVFATRPIPRGTILWTLCDLDQILPFERASVMAAPYQGLLERYAYLESRGVVLCWDLGRYVNHSCTPSMLGVGRDVEIAVRDVFEGEEITSEYGYLNLTRQLRCRCGTPACRSVISAEDVLRFWPRWDGVVDGLRAAARNVAQPLLPYVRDAAAFSLWAEGRGSTPSHRDRFLDRGVAANTSRTR